MLCTVCQIPMMFTEPGEPRWIAYRESVHDGETYHSCSDGCQAIFEHEPQKYLQSWLPVHQILQGRCFKPGTDATAPGFDALAAVLDQYGLNAGRDNLDITQSEDARNFAEWGAGQNPREGQL